jgi:hypothetical protein
MGFCFSARIASSEVPTLLFSVFYTEGYLPVPYNLF